MGHDPLCITHTDESVHRHAIKLYALGPTTYPRQRSRVLMIPDSCKSLSYEVSDTMSV